MVIHNEPAKSSHEFGLTMLSLILKMISSSFSTKEKGGVIGHLLQMLCDLC